MYTYIGMYLLYSSDGNFSNIQIFTIYNISSKKKNVFK